MNDSKAGKVQTVLGLIEADQLGVTLAHDHVLIDGTFMYVEPEEIIKRDGSPENHPRKPWVGGL